MHSTRRHKWAYLGILLGAAIGLYLGWKVFWFLTDDAFIAFRYVSNSQSGLWLHLESPAIPCGGRLHESFCGSYYWTSFGV